jgi:hypothetical protein
MHPLKEAEHGGLCVLVGFAWRPCTVGMLLSAMNSNLRADLATRPCGCDACCTATNRASFEMISHRKHAQGLGVLSALATSQSKVHAQYAQCGVGCVHT